jgi:hypothetical protein
LRCGKINKSCLSIDKNQRELPDYRGELTEYQKGELQKGKLQKVELHIHFT